MAGVNDMRLLVGGEAVIERRADPATLSIQPDPFAPAVGPIGGPLYVTSYAESGPRSIHCPDEPWLSAPQRPHSDKDGGE